MVSAEINAIRNGLILAANISCTKVVIKSDSRSALDAIPNPGGYMGPDTLIITNATLLSFEFSSADYVHLCREANLVVDSLAKHCFRVSLSESWDYNAPNFILAQIVNDMAIV